MCSNARAQGLIKPDLFGKFFKPDKARARSRKPEPDLSPKKSGSTHLLIRARFLKIELMSSSKVERSLTYVGSLI
jgi:hypothetical protein